MVDDSFLLVPMTLFFLYVLFLVARVSLLITIWLLQVGEFEDGSHLRLGDSGLGGGGLGLPHKPCHCATFMCP